MKKRFAVVAALCLVLAVAAPGLLVFAADSASPAVVILHTGDVAGNLQEGEEVIGADRLSSLYKQIQGETPATFLFDTGDAIQGSFYVNCNKGEAAMEIMNAVGYDAMCLGNHEFDYGYERLLELAGLSDFPLLTQPPVYENPDGSPGGDVLTTSVMLDKGGVKVGVFGLTTLSTKRNSDGGFDRNFGSVSDLINTATSCAKTLREQGADIVICLSHLGVSDTQSQDFGSAYDISQNVLGIDLIIDGHTPGVEPINKEEWTPIASVGDAGSEIGMVEIVLEYGAYIPHIKQICKADLVDGAYAGITPDPAVAAIAEKWAAVEAAEGDRIVAHSEVALSDFEKPIIRSQESALANTIADILRAVSGADIAFVNAGNIRAPIEPGDISYRDLQAVMPYANTVVQANVPGSIIREALEFSASLYGTEDGGFLQLSGISYHFNPDKEAGQRVTRITVGDAPLEDDKTYSLTTMDFIAVGGDGYTMLIAPFEAEGAVAVPGGGIVQIVGAYLAEHPIETVPEVGSRIVITSGDSAEEEADTIPWKAVIIAAAILAVVVFLFLRMKKHPVQNKQE
jgi:5'-nucleotidase